MVWEGVLLDADLDGGSAIGLGLLGGREFSTRLARCNKLSVASFNAWYLALPAPRRTINSASQPAFTGIRRTTSRSRRFTLFLSAAFPMRLFTKNANRLVSSPLARYLMTNNLLAALLPSIWI